MNLLFLGTGAADFSPLLQTEFRDRLDQTVRRSSSVLVDGHILIDCGLHTFDTLRLLNVPLAPITDLYVTHLHCDHYYPEGIGALAALTDAPLRIHFREGAPVKDFPHSVLCPMPLYETVCENGIAATALEANHDPSAFPVHYLFGIGGQRLFYGCDGGWMLNRAFRFLRDKKCDCMILDATVGEDPSNFRAAEHNSLPMLRILVPSLRGINALRSDSPVILNHLGITLHEPQAKIEASVAPYGWIPAYDGMRFTF